MTTNRLFSTLLFLSFFLINLNGIKAQIIITGQVTNASCNGSNNGSINASVIGGTPPYQYLWSSGVTTQDMVNLVAGQYCLTVYDASASSATQCFTVNEPCPINITAVITPTATPNTNDGKIDISVTGGTPQYSYAWSNGSTTQDLANISSGTYCVTVTDGNGCTQSNCVTVFTTQNPDPNIFVTYQINSNTCDSSICSGSITVNVTGNVPPPYFYTYAGNNTPGTGSSNSSTFTINNLCAGPYYMNVFAAAGSEYSFNFTISGFSTPLTLPIESSNPAFCNTPGSNTCEKVCPNTSVTYRVDPPGNNCGGTPNFSWDIQGATSFSVSPDTKEVTVVWGAPGNGLVSVTGGNTTSCFSAAKCVEIIEEPVASFTSIPAPASAGATLQICKGQEVFFQNTSLNSDIYEWYFSDDASNSSAENPKHTFDLPGTFTVTLIAKSLCLCSDTTTMQVEVLNTESPLLNCVNTVCPGAIATYTTASVCGSYNWVVSPNGTIVAGGGINDNSVTVQWNSGPDGTITLTVQSCAGVTCSAPAIVRIPILSDLAEIEGVDRVCPKDEEVYKIGPFDGVNFVWKVSPGATIVEGQGTYKISVLWPENPGDHWVAVDYDNCYLGCSGSDTLNVIVRPPFAINGAVQACAGATESFVSKTVGTPPVFVISNWTLYAPDGSVAKVTNNTGIFSAPFNNGPGDYRIVALATGAGINNTCTDQAEWMVKVAPKPVKLSGIAGPDYYCAGNAVAFTAQGVTPGYNVQWQPDINNSSILEGNSIVKAYNSGNYTVVAWQVSADELHCTSDTIQKLIKPILAPPISGPVEVCQHETDVYTTTDYQTIDYMWSIIPADAGMVAKGQGSKDATIFWTKPGMHTVQLTVCSQTTSFQVLVHALPDPLPIAPVGVCQGALDTFKTNTVFAAYAWKQEDGTVISNNPYVVAGYGAYALVATDNFGCTNAKEFYVKEWPKPNLTITTADPTGFCNNAFFVRMLALTSQDGDYQYEWFKDNVSVGNNQNSYITNQYGVYSAKVTNQFGCSAIDGTITVFEYCGPNGVCNNPNPKPPCPPGEISFVKDPTARCDSFLFHLVPSPNYAPGTANWKFFESGSEVLGYKSGDDPYFKFKNGGQYIVELTVLLQNGSECQVIDSVAVDAVAQFSPRPSCPGDATSFKDASTFLPGKGIATWSWNFDDPGSGALNTTLVREPSHLFNNAGIYQVALTVTALSGCTSSETRAMDIPAKPNVVITSPAAGCAGNATPFIIAPAPEIIHLDWNFGDPASGALNVASGDTVFHKYITAGFYTVTVTATSVSGCTATYTKLISITANNLAGQIFPTTAPIFLCEGKTIILSAPQINPLFSYSWSNGAASSTITVGQEGVYELTVTTPSGCSYTPDPKIIQINPAPDGVIKALLTDEFGQLAGVAFPTLEVCKGEDVHLQIFSNGAYNYLWNTTSTDDDLIFSEDRNNLLSVGDHIYSVVMTNPLTGCTAVSAPFTVTVRPVPSGFTATVDNVCGGFPTLVSYVGPQPGNWTYLWNNGESGTTFTTKEAGHYFVRVINEFGCAANSNKVTIKPGPNIAAIPGGCHTRCKPDTLCLPSLPDIVSWQWFLNGVAIPGATSPDFIAQTSGTYWAELIDTAGCHGISDPLDLTLYDGYGDILGKVWSDVNNNGIIDAADTLLSNIPVQLWQSGTQANTGSSGVSGVFAFANILSTNYEVSVDSSALPTDWEIVIGSENAVLSGCDVQDEVGLLLHKFICAASSGILNVSTCPGTNYVYNGTQIAPGASATFTLTTLAGCDSTLTINVSVLSTSANTLNVSACAGTSYLYNGTPVAAGTSQNFVLNNYLGCDSIVTVNVATLPTSASTLNVQVCPGEVYVYNGVPLPIGTSQNFTLVNYLGCDSIVTVNVTALPGSATALSVKTCPGTSYMYNGTPVAIGTSQAFTLINSVGCDSVVTVTVSALSVSTSTLNVQTCPGTTYLYNGTNLPVGASQAFALTGSNGCDSVVTVNVAALPVAASTLNVQTCPGSTYLYNGTDLPVGASQAFTLTGSNGCDSIVTVNVGALPTASANLQIKTCPDVPYVCNGTSIPAGTTQVFHLTGSNGCDSVVTIEVIALPVSTALVKLNTCPGETVTYQGTALSAGQSAVFHELNYLGCDSAITVQVLELPTSTQTLAQTVCPGTAYDYNGVMIQPGQTQSFTLTGSNGCDSTVVVSVSAYPDLSFATQSTPSCTGTASGTASVMNLAGGAAPYLYSIDGQNFQDSVHFTQLAAGNYTLYVQDSNDCQFEQTTQVGTYGEISAALQTAYISCDSAFVTLQPILSGDLSNLEYKWSNGATTPTTTVSDAGTVWLEVKNQCVTLHQEAKVYWAELGDTSFVYVPNTFSPDASLVENQMFRAYFAAGLDLLSYDIELYDRWGSRIFRSEQPESGWEGPYRGRKVEPGVYVWLLHAKFKFCGREFSITRKGDVMLYR